MTDNPMKGARLSYPQVQEMGGNNPEIPAFVRAPFYPTAPFYSTNPNVGYQTRFYSTGIEFGVDVDYTVGQESIRRIQFDLPCIMVAMNGSAQTTTNVMGAMTGVNPRTTFLYRIEYTTGDQITVGARLGSCYLGAMDTNIGQMGGTGYTCNTGSSVAIGLTPLFTTLRIDVVLVMMELRGGSSFIR